MASYMGHEYTPAPTQVVQGRYRVGDRVRVVKDGGGEGGSGHRSKVGDVTTLVNVDLTDRWPYEGEWYYKAHEIAPAFRPGDRVKLNKHSGFRACGERGTVSAVIGDNVSVRMDDASAYGTVVAFFHADDLDWERVEDCPVKPAPDCAVRKDEQGDVETLTIKLEADTSGFIKAIEEAHEAVIQNLRAGLISPTEARTELGLTPFRWGIQDTAIVALVKDGKPRPSTYPHVHADVASATKEAERLARNNPGQEFAVYQRVAGRIAEVSYSMKEVA